MRLLVTGGAGFIGSNFIRYWLVAHPTSEVVNVDSLTYAGNLESVSDLLGHPGYRFAQLDIREGERLLPLLEGVDCVVHFAAESHVDRSILGPGTFIQTNIVGSQVLFDAARSAKVPRFVHISTDEVYGSLGSEGRFREDSPYAPNSPYSASKAASDLLARSYYKTYGFPVIITHASNNYGPYQFPEKFIPLFILNALAGKSLPLYGQGENRRDWLHVNDHCAGIEAAILRGKPGEVYNFGGECERDNLSIARAICRLTGRDESLIHFVKDRPGHDFRYAIDTAKARRELGFVPRHTLEEALPDLIAWYQTQHDWVAHIESGDYRRFINSWYGERT